MPRHNTPPSRCNDILMLAACIFAAATLHQRAASLALCAKAHVSVSKDRSPEWPIITLQALHQCLLHRGAA